MAIHERDGESFFCHDKVRAEDAERISLDFLFSGILKIKKSEVGK